MSDLSVVDDDTATISSTHTSDSHSFTRPAPTKVMSNHAEEELLDLATNFLLYVAMVIIVVMVARIYWPHLLVRGTPSPPFAKGNEGGGIGYRDDVLEDVEEGEERKEGEEGIELISKSKSYPIPTPLHHLLFAWSRLPHFE